MVFTPQKRTCMKRIVTGLILFLTLFGFYLFNMSPTVSEGDSGEFVTAAVNLSIPHAPGYPLYTLLGKIGEKIGGEKIGVTLLSGVCMAGAAVAVCATSLVLGVPIAGALTAGLLFGVCAPVFENALNAEVFGLHALMVSLVVLIMARACVSDTMISRRMLYAACFLIGLGAGNHQTIVLLFPGIILVFLMVHSLRIKNNDFMVPVADMLVMGFFTALGLTVYFVLMIRSIKDPFLDWSNPENFRNLWRVFTRADYGTFSLTLGEKVPLTLSVIIKQVEMYIKALYQQFTGIGILLGISGMAGFFWKSEPAIKRFGVFGVISFLFSSIVFLMMANMPFSPQAQGVIGRFYIMPAVLFAVAIGYACALVPQRLGNRICIVLLCIPVVLGIINQDAYGRRGYYTAYDYGMNILRTLPYNAVLFIDGGDDTFYTLCFLTRVMNKRPDLRIHDRGGLIFPNPYGDDFRRIGKENKTVRRRQVESAVLESGRRLFYSTMNKKILDNVALYQRGILFEASMHKEKYKNLWPFYSYRGVYDSSLAEHIYRVRALIPIYDYLKGIDAFDRAMVDKGFSYYERAYRIGYDISWLIQNISYDLEARGYRLFVDQEYNQAEKIYRYIVHVNPEHVMAYVNLGVIAEKKGNLEESKTWYLKALAVKPDHVEAHYNLSVVYWQMKQWDKVITQLRKVLELNPNHAQARKYLQIALSKKGRQ
ncbi:MAG: DUF2723 domain-containing protein [Elusimicrobia bacterium]|nr:DUF2723 domain-containing protein [Elusimicrobiota bacterium]